MPIEGWVKRLLLICLAVVLPLAAAATLLPLIEANDWWIRYTDFIRIQLSIVLLALLAGALAWILFSRRSAVALGTVAVLLPLLGYQASKLHSYSPLVAPVAPTRAACPAEARVTILSANLQRGNRDADAVLDLVRSRDPDMVFAMETNGWWDRQLEPLSERYAHMVQDIPRDATYYGLHLFSRLDLIDPRTVHYFGADTPTVTTGVRLASGATFTFAGVHPRPPQSFSQPTTLRDGHLARVALDAAISDRPVVVAGDFNAVSWERIFRQMARVGGFLDPRIGRGPIPSYAVGNPLMAWPLDHVLFQADVGLIGFERLPAIGSDHYPIMATLCVDPGGVQDQRAPAPAAGDVEELRTAFRSAEAIDMTD